MAVVLEVQYFRCFKHGFRTTFIDLFKNFFAMKMGIQNGQFSQHKCHGIVLGLIRAFFSVRCTLAQVCNGNAVYPKNLLLIFRLSKCMVIICYALEPPNSFPPKTNWCCYDDMVPKPLKPDLRFSFYLYPSLLILQASTRCETLFKNFPPATLNTTMGPQTTP